MSTKQKVEELVEILRHWQKIESRSMALCAEVIEQTRNPAIRLVMEIIQRDSAMHHKVQQFIVDAVEREAVSLTVEELERVWTALEAHIEDERRTAPLVAAAQKALEGTKDVVQQYLLAYLAADERKHDQLLDGLDLIKRGMYRSA